MSSKMATSGPHAAGIFADMTVDGPEIGTLVAIVDRGKNLPNRRTMGKQSAYCAARLGKEARKTETDKRGGQTPRWDQELRFTVHDSPDYYSLKISVFSEDKKTDLIGEAWIDLANVVVPGGGKGDLWQSLTCKGKYAGELRVELTYYDTREKPDSRQENVSVADELKAQYGTLQPKVKRRPLPTNPNAPVATDVVIPERALPGRAKHGPRDYSTPPRATSLPPKTYNYPQSESTLFGHSALSKDNSPVPQAGHDQLAESQYYVEHDQIPAPQVHDPRSGVPEQLDFLPQLSSSHRQRASPLSQQPRYAQRQLPQAAVQPRPMSHVGVPHSHSAPAVPVTHQLEPQAYDDSHILRTDYPEPIPDVEYQHQRLRQRRNDMPPGWQDEYGGAYSMRQAYAEDDPELSPPPPPPPMHSNSSPAVPQYHSQGQSPSNARYGTTPPGRQQYLPNSSPLQAVERYGHQQTPPSQGHPRRGQSFDEYAGQTPYEGRHHSTPNLSSPAGHGPSPYSGRPSPYAMPTAGHHSLDYGTPSRQPHPLSQEVPRARSPNPYATPESYQPYHERARADAVPMIKPRTVSPQPPAQSRSAPKSTYSIQFPVRSFESSDESPLSTSRPAGQVPRKSVSPRPSTSGGSSHSIPFSPDSFGAHPSAPQAEAEPPKGPIVGWHGQEIDPSDHLPVDSWAPEPTKKTPTKTYGMGREKEFGPRSLSKDTVINVRMKPGSNLPEQQTQPVHHTPSPGGGKIRGVLKKGRSPAERSPIAEPLRNHDNFNPVPNPYEQQPYTGRAYHGGSPGYGHLPPQIPPKVPLSQYPRDYGYGEDALSREISSIDIGTSRRGTSPAAFVPVRSHRDRNNFF